MNRRISVFSLAVSSIVLWLVLFPLVSLAQYTPDQRRTISVTGEAKVHLEPNRALITVGVETEGKDPVAVKRENDERIQKLMEAITASGIKRADVQTSSLNIQPVYNYDNGKRTFVKYTMNNQVTITLRDINNVGTVVNNTIAKGGNVLHGLQFFVADAEKIRDSLRVEAIKVAKEKASNIVSAVDMKVTHPISIDAQSDGGYSPIMFKQNMANARFDGNAEMSSTDVSGGLIVIKANVSVVFEIEPK